MPRYSASLTSSGIEKLIRQVKDYQTRVDEKTRIIAQRLAERGVDVACVKLVSYKALFTGDLMASMREQLMSMDVHGATFVVKADSEHAAFVEFGTGYVGNDSPYPYPLTGIDWQYISGNQIVANAKNGIYGWFYKGSDGNVYFTEGMPSRPFMYETSLQLAQETVKIVRQAFREK